VKVSLFFRFILVGGLGFVIDVGLTYLLIQFNVAPWMARAPAIMLAMIFTWLANRHFTYGVKTSRSSREAIRYATVAMGMALINYVIFFVLLRYGVRPVFAVIFATAFQTMLSFFAYRRFVFGRVV
jgi:putative flippase GtrA